LSISTANVCVAGAVSAAVHVSVQPAPLLTDAVHVVVDPAGVAEPSMKTAAPVVPGEI
jgi:hypothetical protein